jgi:hypothetical protein
MSTDKLYNEEETKALSQDAVSRRFFRLKRQEKEFNGYVEKLGITTEGEKFVLHHILSRDWNRDLILISIDTIKFSDKGYGGLVHVECRTRNGSYDFSVSHLDSDGWDIHTTLEEQESYVSRDLYHKMD